MPAPARRGRRARYLAGAAVLLAALVVPVPGARAARVHVGATTSVIQPAGLTGDGDPLETRVIRVGPGGGQVVVGADGRVRTDGDVTLGPGGRPALNRLALPDLGQGRLRLARGATLTGPGGAVRVTDFTSDLPAEGVLWGGSRDVAVGATIRLPGGLSPGLYVGSYDLTVEND